MTTGSQRRSIVLCCAFLLKCRQIYLPGTGWMDFDPTSGSIGKVGLVTVAVLCDPHHAIPQHGTFIGLRRTISA